MLLMPGYREPPASRLQPREAQEALILTWSGSRDLRLNLGRTESI
jgi:hypothetical protein